METLRTLQLVAAVLLVGGPAFTALIWRPALRSLPDSGQREALEASLGRWIRLFGTVSALALAYGAVADVLRLASTLAQAPMLSGPAFSLAVDLVRSSIPGQMAFVRALAGFGLLACRPWRTTRRVNNVAAGALSLMILASFSLTGHAVATPGSALFPVLGDLLHMGATAAWYGGLFYFVFLPWRSLRAEANLPVLASTVDRFSRLGLMAVAILALTGLYMSALRLYGMLALVEHPYGTKLLQKLVFVGGVLALAAVNHFWVRPRLRGGEALSAGRLLRWLVTGEAAVGMAVLVLAGALSTTAPPQGEPVRIEIELTEFHYSQPVVEVERGKPVKLTVVNKGTVPHSYVIKAMPHDTIGAGHDHGESEDMHLVAYPGERKTVTLVPRRAGTYEVYCMVAGHLEEGETGLFVVK